jgi:hypothetical protein
MPLANLTIVMHRLRLVLTGLFLTAFFPVFAQENSPYTRFGVGDVQQATNVVNRSMGGISQGYTDHGSYIQSINFANPASVANLFSAQFDIAADITSRGLKSNSNPDKFKAVNTILSYVQVGLPLTPNKWYAKKQRLALAFGLKPLTKINYKVRVDERLPGIDIAATLFEGDGGINQANITLAFKKNNFSIGASSGYNFGTRKTSSERVLLNDTIGGYYKRSNTVNNSSVGGVFLNIGAQYTQVLKAKGDTVEQITFGATANLQSNLKGTRTKLVETVDVGFDGTLVNVDTVSFSPEKSGKIAFPATYAFGATYSNLHWIVGAEFETTQWTSFSNFAEKDPLQNSYRVKIGAQYFPATSKTDPKKKLAFLRYRAGAYYGTDYIKSRREFGVTFGTGFILMANRFGEYASLNTGFDYGIRNSNVASTLRENIFRINVGLSLSGAWFRKRKYD